MLTKIFDLKNHKMTKEKQWQYYWFLYLSCNLKGFPWRIVCVDCVYHREHGWSPQWTNLQERTRFLLPLLDFTLHSPSWIARAIETSHRFAPGSLIKFHQPNNYNPYESSRTLPGKNYSDVQITVLLSDARTLLNDKLAEYQFYIIWVNMS